jgi:hypothetical protein
MRQRQQGRNESPDHLLKAKFYLKNRKLIVINTVQKNQSTVLGIEQESTESSNVSGYSMVKSQFQTLVWLAMI